MKTLLVACCLIFALTGEARGQSSPVAAAQHGVEVVRFRWSKERINWERDPFAGPVENFEQMRTRARDEKRIDDAKRGGSQAELSKAEREARADAANTAASRQPKRAPRYVFLYKASFRNTSAKTVKAIDWDYIFFDRGTQSETGRHQFTSDGKIAPGKSREFSFMLPRPPSQTISVYALDEGERKALDERVVILRVEFADGTTWQPPTTQTEQTRP